MTFLIILILILLFSYSFYEYQNYKVVRIKVEDFQIRNGIPKELQGKKIVFASDFQFDHKKRVFYHKACRKVMNLIRDEDYDLLILGGDYIHQKCWDNKLIFDYLKELPGPKIGVLGNHDYKDYETVINGLNKSNVRVLKNNIIEYCGLQIIGVDDLKKGSIELPEYNSTQISLLVSHNPDYIGSLPVSAVDMMLSGHLHGGQLTLFGKLGPSFASKYGMELMHGLKRKQNISLYVSSGVGGSVYRFPIRFCARPEIVSIEF